MATYSELQTEVLENLIDTPTAVQNRVPRLVNRAIRDIQKDHNFLVMEQELAVNTVVGVRSLGSLPSTFKAWRYDGRLIRDDGSVKKVLVDVNRQEVGQDIGEDTTGEPLWVARSLLAADGSSTLDVWPLPDGNSDYVDGEYRLIIPYNAYTADLSGAGDTNWFTVNAEAYIVNKATSEGFAVDWDEERMALWAQRAATEWKKLLRTDKLLRFSGVRELVPNFQGVNIPQTRL